MEKSFSAGAIDNSSSGNRHECSEGRINTPSTLGGNWQWRALPGFDSPALAKRLLRQMKLYERLPQEREDEKL